MRIGVRPWTWWVAAGALIPVVPAFNLKRLLLTAALSLIVLLALVRVRFAKLSPRLGLAAIAVLFLGLVSASISAAPGWSMLDVAYTLACGLAISALACDLPTARLDPTRIIGFGFVLPVALCCCAVCVSIYTAACKGVAVHYPVGLPHFANIRFFNQYQTWTLPFLTAALAYACPLPCVRTALWRAFIVGIAALFWALFWRTSGRGTGYATLIAAVVVVLIFGRRGRLYAIRSLMLAGAGWLVNFAMFGLGGSRSSTHLVSTALRGRGYLWDIAIEQINAAPWLGIGPMMFAAIDNGKASHPHSAPLQWAVEWGLPAAMLLLTSLGYLALRWIYAARRAIISSDHVPGASALIVAITASLVAGGVHALVSGVIVMPASQFMLVTVVALAVGVGLQQTGMRIETQNPKSHSIRRFIFSLCVAITLVYIVGFTIHDYCSRVIQPAPNTPVHRRNRFHPRYWNDGTLTTVVDPPIHTRVIERKKRKK